MRQWIHKLINQFDLDWQHKQESGEQQDPVDISEERATLLYLIDTYNKNLFEIDSHPVRKVREVLDEFGRGLVNPDDEKSDKLLYRFRQFFSSYRIDEYTYIQKTFEDFRSIIWDFVDQLSEDLAQEEVEDKEIMGSLDQLKDAVEANSIDVLKAQSREFIDSYVEFQTKREDRRSHRLKSVKMNLDLVKEKLVQAHHSMRRDHLTNAFNRKSFDEQMKQNWRLFKLSKVPVTLVTLDIDHFKKVNDTYGHAIGDFVLVELVKVLTSIFSRESDFVARVGGEEFAVILPDYAVEHAVVKAKHALDKIREAVFVQDEHKINFTISMGIAQLIPGESVDEWVRRADEALYMSKNGGRDRYTLASTAQQGNDAA